MSVSNHSWMQKLHRHRPQVVSCRLDGLRIMMEFPKPKDDEEQAAENITERKQVGTEFFVASHIANETQPELNMQDMLHITVLSKHSACLSLVSLVHRS